MVDIDNLFPIDSGITKKDIEDILGRPEHIRRNVALGAGAVAATIIAFEIFQHFKPFTGIDVDQD